MIFFSVIDIFYSAIEAQYYIRSVHGEDRCIRNVPKKANKICITRSALHGFDHGWLGEYPDGHGLERNHPGYGYRR